MKTKLSITFLSLAFTALGQTCITSDSRGNFIVAASCGSANAVWTEGTGRTWNSIPPETRKPKVPAMTIALVKASAHPINRREMAPASYVALAKSIGINSAAVDEAVILNTISELGLPVYDFNKVDEYLYEQTLHMKAGTRWVWKPMRESDSKGASGSFYTTFPTAGYVIPDIYDKAIPERALNAVANIIAKQPDVMFLVSDFSVIKPDPFLAITTTKLLSQGKIWIICNWDEPGFMDKPDVHSIVTFGGIPKID